MLLRHADLPSVFLGFTQLWWMLPDAGQGPVPEAWPVSSAFPPRASTKPQHCSVWSRHSGSTVGVGGARRVPWVPRECPPSRSLSGPFSRHPACFCTVQPSPVAHRNDLDRTSFIVSSSFQAHSLLPPIYFLESPPNKLLPLKSLSQALIRTQLCSVVPAGSHSSFTIVFPWGTTMLSVCADLWR